MRSLLARSMLCKTQHTCTTVGRNSSFIDDFVPISLKRALSIPKPLSTLIRVEECLRLNHASSLVNGNPMGPILNGVMHQLKRGYPLSATIYGGNARAEGHVNGSSWKPPIIPASTFRYSSELLKCALSCNDPGGPVFIEVK